VPGPWPGKRVYRPFLRTSIAAIITEARARGRANPGSLVIVPAGVGPAGGVGVGVSMTYLE